MKSEGKVLLAWKVFTATCFRCWGIKDKTSRNKQVAEKYFRRMGWKVIGGKWYCGGCANKLEKEKQREKSNR